MMKDNMITGHISNNAFISANENELAFWKLCMKSGEMLGFCFSVPLVSISVRHLLEGFLEGFWRLCA